MEIEMLRYPRKFIESDDCFYVRIWRFGFVRRDIFNITGWKRLIDNDGFIRIWFDMYEYKQ